MWEGLFENEGEKEKSDDENGEEDSKCLLGKWK